MSKLVYVIKNDVETLTEIVRQLSSLRYKANPHQKRPSLDEYERRVESAYWFAANRLQVLAHITQPLSELERELRGEYKDWRRHE